MSNKIESTDEAWESGLLGTSLEHAKPSKFQGNVEMTHKDIVAAWNAQADGYNQWCELDDEEKTNWAISLCEGHVLSQIAQRIKPCGFVWLNSSVFRKKVPSYATVSDWAPVYNHSTIMSAIAATRSSYLQVRINKLEQACGGRCNAEYNPCHDRVEADKLKKDAP